MKRIMLCIALATGLMGCARGFEIATPDGFAELDEEGHYDYRATNADGVVLGVRKKANDPAGDLGFWSGALDAHLRRAGYAPVKHLDVESADGIRGRQLRYQRQLEGRAHHYWVTVYVTANSVVTVEAGGDEAFFSEKKSAVEKAIRSLRM